MSLQFIIGGSGSGKTRTLYENLIRQSMEEPDGRFFALVPEQFTMQTQKEIVMLHPNHGVMNIDIVSFERLAYRVFEELAIENLAVLDDMGKSMVLRRVSSGVRGSMSGWPTGWWRRPMPCSALAGSRGLRRKLRWRGWRRRRLA